MTIDYFYIHSNLGVKYFITFSLVEAVNFFNKAVKEVLLEEHFQLKMILFHSFSLNLMNGVFCLERKAFPVYYLYLIFPGFLQILQL